MKVGIFACTSGKLIVSDPCYERDLINNKIMGLLENCKKGPWEAEVEIEDGRVYSLWIYHHSSQKTEAMQEMPFEVGVDSGQAGFFDDNIYPPDKSLQGEYGELDTFYGKCCDKTSSDSDNRLAGIIEGQGVVSSSGYGDGGYTCYAGKNAEGEIVSALIVFIDEYDEEDEDVWEDENEYEDEEDEEDEE